LLECRNVKGKEQEEAEVWNFQDVPRDAIVKGEDWRVLDGLLSRPTPSSWWRRIGWKWKRRGCYRKGRASRLDVNRPLVLGGRMERIAEIGDYITVPNSTTIGTVKAIKDGDAAIGSDPMLVYEIETNQGMMRLPADWLARLIAPA
jgi:hypothetical protein